MCLKLCSCDLEILLCIQRYSLFSGCTQDSNALKCLLGIAVGILLERLGFLWGPNDGAGRKLDIC